MRLVISKDKTIHDVQQEFSSQFPFLKLEFYKLLATDPDLPVKKHLPPSTSLKAAGLRVDDGEIFINRSMTVGELEKQFFRKFGLEAQVSRKSGMLWLETTMTDNWTLQKQNEHGREISIAARVFPRDRQSDEWGLSGDA